MAYLIQMNLWFLIAALLVGFVTGAWMWARRRHRVVLTQPDENAPFAARWSVSRCRKARPRQRAWLGRATPRFRAVADFPLFWMRRRATRTIPGGLRGLVPRCHRWW